MIAISSEDIVQGAILLIDKPYGWTSFDVVRKVKYALSKHSGIKKVKVGHAGTLDPLATGLLIVCVGRFTKKIEEIQAMPKAYSGTFYIGATTPSYDLETEVDAHYATTHITPELIEQARQRFVGDIMQVAPIHSAKKINGQRAYDLARKGEEVEMKQSHVSIYDFALPKIEMPIIHFEVKCSKGTYIRSLAFDFGLALQSGAYMASLRRTAIGEYKVDDALQMKDFDL